MIVIVDAEEVTSKLPDARCCSCDLGFEAGQKVRVLEQDLQHVGCEGAASITPALPHNAKKLAHAPPPTASTAVRQSSKVALNPDASNPVTGANLKALKKERLANKGKGKGGKGKAGKGGGKRKKDNGKETVETPPDGKGASKEKVDEANQRMKHYATFAKPLALNGQTWFARYEPRKANKCWIGMKHQVTARWTSDTDATDKKTKSIVFHHKEEDDDTAFDKSAKHAFEEAKKWCETMID